MPPFTRSSHLGFDRALGPVFGAFVLSVLLVMWVSSLRITSPYHDRRFCVRTEFIGLGDAYICSDGFILIRSFHDFILTSTLWYNLSLMSIFLVNQ